MADSVYDQIEASARALKLDFGSKEAASLAEKNNFSSDQLEAIQDVMKYLEEKKHETIINTLLRLSRLPLKVPKTFENYDFTQIHGKDTTQLKNLSALSEIYAGKNIALIGPPGVGKTHLAEAYGRACCEAGLKTYFLKASELNERFANARNLNRVGKTIAGLVKPSCLIIDEIGRGDFDKDNTELFFEVVDRRYQKDGPNTMIFTSNLQPSQWSEHFHGKEDLQCALDRIFNNARVFNIHGNSYRGRKMETYAVEAGTVTSN